MKKFLVFLSLSMLVSVNNLTAVQNSSALCSSKDAKSISIGKSSVHHGSKAPARIFITAVYEPAVNQVLIEFLRSVGDGTVRLVNLETGAEVSGVFSASSTALSLPVLSDGSYELVFELTSGGRLYGTFNTD